MRMSQALIPTLRDVPNEAEIISHQLLLRGGFIRRSAAGMYTYMPLAKRVLTKIETIIREEMDNSGGQELMMPIVQPAELWEESGRWNAYGDEMIRVTDRHNRQFCLGPTHEEVITDLVRNQVSSYRQLPQLLYQIQNKYRDERRPRFGLMRGREFIMKDLYSFDRDEAGLDVSYRKMYDAYTRIFNRCGLTFRPVEADGGAIGGSSTHEFMVLADNGEGTIVYCDSCDYAANIEIAPCPKAVKESTEEAKELEKVHTPDTKTIDEVANFLKVDPKQTIKTLFFQADEQIIAVVVRGDRDVNDIKVQHVHPCLQVELADEEKVKEITGCEVGFVGPIGITGIPVYADWEVEVMANAVCGANESQYHYINVSPTRDFKVTGYFDLRLVEIGEPCPKCGATLSHAKGIEVGQVFKLGTRYSEALKATFLDENGKSQIMQMGCYGIGVSRTMAATVEQNYDENGIIWPKAIAPYSVIVVPVSAKDEEQMKIAEDIYKQLRAKGIDVILDDRNERPGVKFKDADLIGIPVRLTIGKKTPTEGTVEYKLRTESDLEVVALDEVVEKTIAYLNA